MGYPNFYILVYHMYIYSISLVLLFLQNMRRPGGWCRRSCDGLAAPVPSTMASVGLVCSSTTFTPKPAVRHTGDLPICVLTALSVG